VLSVLIGLSGVAGRGPGNRSAGNPPYNTMRGAAGRERRKRSICTDVRSTSVEKEARQVGPSHQACSSGSLMRVILAARA